jgi:hypothetical protein
MGNGLAVSAFAGNGAITGMVPQALVKIQEKLPEYQHGRSLVDMTDILLTVGAESDGGDFGE